MKIKIKILLLVAAVTERWGKQDAWKNPAVFLFTWHATLM
jgi:hypothetical protein